MNMINTILTAALLTVASTAAFAEDTKWIQTSDGWFISEDMQCANPAKYGITCQYFTEPTEFVDENIINGSSTTDVLKNNPGVERLINNGVTVERLAVKV